jgi:HPt (histidine-containing phosphotransfer) domain-containing protein
VMPSTIDINDMRAVPQTFAEPVDLALLASYEEIQLDGEPDLIVELIDLYLEDAPRRVASMRESLSSVNWLSVKREAHGLRGSSGSLGVLQMALICGEIEAADGTESHSTVAAQLSCLERELERVVPIFLAERQRRLQ